MSNYKQLHNADQNVHFSKALMGETERSGMMANPIHITTFNAGDIVPIYCREVLPSESLSLDLEFVIRQTTLLTPTMGSMDVEFHAFFVPNRVVNQSWKAVEGENLSGSWTAPNVSLARLITQATGTTKIPVGSVADYYGFPWQAPIPNAVLSRCHDLKFRGYVMIYNEYFRDQNYQPPIPMSTLNVYQGFFDDTLVSVPLDDKPEVVLTQSTVPDGSFGAGAIAHALYGSGFPSEDTEILSRNGEGRFSALSKPLKANKHHDYFTSVLPSPQKSNSPVFAPVSGSLNIPQQLVTTTDLFDLSGAHPSLQWRRINGDGVWSETSGLLAATASGATETNTIGTTNSPRVQVYPSNLVTTPTSATTDGLAISVDDIRMASAIEQIYEVLARGGSRYRCIVRSFFGIEAENPYEDIPTRLGFARRSLDLYQTAQTSPSEVGATPQGNLAAFGYTSNSCKLFDHTFLEHGYVHVFAIVRHRNLYSSYLARDNFRLNMLDFFLPQLANISEQPVFAYEVNPFAPKPLNAFGYQEAWAEYRYEPDMVSGYMRTAPSDTSDSISVWNYADDFDSSLQISNGKWLKSNSEQVLNRTLAVTSDIAPQFKAAFSFKVYKELPIPTYSVPGMDII